MIVELCLPVVGKVIFLVVSITFNSNASFASANNCSVVATFALTVTVNSFVTDFSLIVIVAVNVTSTSLAGYAGRVTTPVFFNALLLEAHVIVELCLPVVGKVIFSATSFTSNVNASFASANNCSIVTSSALTVTVNSFVTDFPLIVIVAVNVTSTSSSLYAGRVTTPVFEIALLSDAHVIVELCLPVVGKVIFSVVSLTFNVNASFASANNCSTVASVALTITVNLFVKGFAPSNVNVAVNVTLTSPAGYTGRVTTPVFEIAALFDVHVIFALFLPVVGKVIFSVVSLTFNVNAFLASVNN